MDGVLESFSWSSFFSTRGVDYKGDEVKTAKYFAWKNIAPALPEEIGRVPLEQVCTLGPSITWKILIHLSKIHPNGISLNRLV